MRYPFWDPGVGYGVLMAVISVVHVFISHFAIGGGLYLVVAETSARRRQDAALLAFLPRLTKFFVLLTLVLGALTGVGIWFIIGLLNPAATEVLIRNFVWAWATEWVFFFLEISAALIYHYGWQRMDGRDHLIVGWIYFGAAWLSLFVINGIITFMLTPGEWLATGSFWDGFFNPTFWPSLVLRTGICIMLAGLYTEVIASRERDDSVRGRLIRGSALWGLGGLALMAPSSYWYWRAIPVEVTAAVIERGAASLGYASTSLVFAAVIGVGLLGAAALPRRIPSPLAIVLLAAGLCYFGSFEWFRESVRKPFIISGYMYGNAVEVARADAYRRDGYLAHIAVRSGDDGADLFRHACASCHTLSGYKALAPHLAGADVGFITAVIRGTGAMRARMPEFFGTEEEAAAIAAYIHQRIDQRHLAEITGLEGAALGERVWNLRCGMCHVLGGFRDISDTVVGADADDLASILDEAGDYDDAMPAFSGDERESTALIDYLTGLTTP